MDMYYLSGIMPGLKKAIFALVALMFAVTAGSSQAGNTATATLIINVNFRQPTCDINVPSSYDLGVLSAGGAVEHRGFDITWNCGTGESLKTALTASIVRGTAVGDDQVRLLRDDGQATGASLSLKENRQGASPSPVKLTGATDYFCSDESEVTGMRTCTLTPVTKVDQGGPFGLASATLKFKVGYP